MQSHFLDCQGIRSAKNGRWVLVLLRKNTQQGKRGCFNHILKNAWLSDPIEVSQDDVAQSLYKRILNNCEILYGNLHPWVTTQNEKQKV